ncbi:TonB-dependent receptor [Sphingobium nicotianae]|uniref:TonB-dependent receptor n=1 Tax=Sphingobium nicotianae TaxID=2782607 RepID=A0A9X1DCD0_9SPHN|nr:TonB-dependent receptor [Sphingobium nicotianae]MBT2187358.1 TonB-dependent receptor [Sphingobium nicotianae]
MSAGKGRRLLAGSCLAALAAFAQPAFAQNAATPQTGAAPQDSAATTDDQGITDIVVTARYVSENVQDTPIAITAQTSTQLQAANVTQLSTLGAVVPNLFTMPGDSQSAGTPVIGMRGVTQGSTSSLAVPPALAIYTDDIYHSTTAGSELDFTDIDHIEVNRGPQSTLSGNASIAGSIKLYTVDPKGDGSGYLQVVGGSYKKLGISGALDLGLTSNLSMRVSGNFERQDGYGNRLDFSCMMDKLGTPQYKGTLPYFQPDSRNRDCIIGHLGGGTKAVGQVKLLWKPTDKISWLVTARHREEDLEETPEVALFYQTACAAATTVNPSQGIFIATPAIGPAGCTPSTASAAAVHRAAYNTFGITSGSWFITPQRNGGIYDTYATNCRPLLNLQGGGFPAGYPTGYCYDQGKTAHHTLLSSKLNWELTDDINLTWIGGYTNYGNEFTQNGDQSPLGYVVTHFVNTDKQYSSEARLDGKLFDGKLQWVVGGFWLKMNGYQKTHVDFVNIFQNSIIHGINNSKSAFFHLDYNLTDRWRVSGGARYTDSEIIITIDNPQAVSVLVPVTSSTKRPDWLISTDYKITDDIMAYASAASGSRPPGLTTITGTPRQLQATSDEDLISYEAGIKADWFDRKLRTNLTAFYIDYRKLSTAATGIECRNQPGAVATWFSANQNSPEAITICSQFPGAPSPITFTQNVGIPAKVRGFEWDITANPVQGLRIDWTGGYNSYQSGVKTPNTPGYLWPGNYRQPQWNQHADISYEIESPIGSFTPRLDWTWQSLQTYDTTPQAHAPAAKLTIPAYSLFNAQIAYRAPDRGWTATLAVTNLANKWYHYQVMSGVINDQTRVGEPREWTLTIRKNF